MDTLNRRGREKDTKPAWILEESINHSGLFSLTLLYRLPGERASYFSTRTHSSSSLDELPKVIIIIIIIKKTIKSVNILFGHMFCLIDISLTNYETKSKELQSRTKLLKHFTLPIACPPSMLFWQVGSETRVQSTL